GRLGEREGDQLSVKDNTIAERHARIVGEPYNGAANVPSDEIPRATFAGLTVSILQQAGVVRGAAVRSPRGLEFASDERLGSSLSVEEHKVEALVSHELR